MTGTATACTLGANVFDVPFRAHRYFLTASHCTGVEGSVRGTRFYQLQPRAIGTEVHDYPFNGTDTNLLLLGRGCPGLCRFADVAFVEYDAGLTWGMGKLARTAYPYPSSVYHEISTAFPTYTVTQAADFPVLGERVEKMGVGSGWTFGTVNRTCVDVQATNPQGQAVHTMCQMFVAGAAVRGGDSGAPVFRLDNTGAATLLGIAWAGFEGSPSVLVFSSMRNIELQFGATFSVVADP